MMVAGIWPAAEIMNTSSNHLTNSGHHPHVESTKSDDDIHLCRWASTPIWLWHISLVMTHVKECVGSHGARSQGLSLLRGPKLGTPDPWKYNGGSCEISPEDPIKLKHSISMEGLSKIHLGVRTPENSHGQDPWTLDKKCLQRVLKTWSIFSKILTKAKL